MPLPTDVGQGLASYLEQARPRCACREVFVRHRALEGGLTRMAIRHVASSAISRARITGVCLGSHTFRHKLATDLLRHGASLDEIGEVLRHKDASTTAIYAKVDLTTLRSLAMCWPGRNAMNLLRNRRWGPGDYKGWDHPNPTQLLIQ